MVAAASLDAYPDAAATMTEAGQGWFGTVMAGKGGRVAGAAPGGGRGGGGGRRRRRRAAGVDGRPERRALAVEPGQEGVGDRAGAVGDRDNDLEGRVRRRAAAARGGLALHGAAAAGRAAARARAGTCPAERLVRRGADLRREHDPGVHGIEV